MPVDDVLPIPVLADELGKQRPEGVGLLLRAELRADGEVAEHLQSVAAALAWLAGDTIQIVPEPARRAESGTVELKPCQRRAGEKAELAGTHITGGKERSLSSVAHE